MRMYSQGLSRLRVWVILPTILFSVAGIFLLVGSATQNTVLAVLAVAGALAGLGFLIIFRVIRIAVPMKREQEMARLIESMAESFKEKIGDQKRQNYFTAKKRFEAAVSAIGAAKRDSMQLYVADLKQADSLLHAGRYDAATTIFESLASLAQDNRDPAFDALEMYAAVQHFGERRSARKKKARAQRGKS